MFTDTRSKEIVNFCIKNYIPYFIGNPRNDKAVDFIKKFPTDVILSINYLFIINSDLNYSPRENTDFARYNWWKYFRTIH